MSAYYLTRDTANRMKSDIILRHYAAGTWPSKRCTEQLEAVESAYQRQTPNFVLAMPKRSEAAA